MDWIFHPDAWAAFITLTALEVVLGIDNLVFLSIVTQKLPEDQRARARTIGLLLALVGRVALLLSIAWVMGLTDPLFEVFGRTFSGRDLVLLIGGLFLIYKATREIHEETEGPDEEFQDVTASTTFLSALVQIFLLDLVFSLDSVITAVGMADRVSVMISAVCVAIVFMIAAAKSVTGFIERHPTVKMLALSFLLLVGVALVADGLQQHFPRGYIYAAMGFSMFNEVLNMRRRKKRQAEA
ncbi:Integral membrane protein TerC family protein [Planctomycetes bacterium Poly30]|uniref:Integral membrane protein TerC family protein n=1 Tax=Saltatorellus ferox TaxID=2528018 RepID=A0A518EKN6_9BACT|nr:Integral membrane protein TerC family protein [Planctomycetes bacterium Poly30]